MNKMSGKDMNYKLFDFMSMDEKIEIASGDFAQLYRRLVNKFDPNTKEYIDRKYVFDTKYMRDGGEQMIAAINRSRPYSDELWEIPKGRMKRQYSRRNECKFTESELECAVREFGEESGIRKDMYRVYGGERRVYSFQDDGDTYVCVYYLAIAIAKNIPKNLVAKNIYNVKEVTAIKWVTMQDLQYLSKSPFVSQSGLVKFAKPLFRWAKNKLKN